MKSVMCVIGSLSSGGAEHQMVELATLLEKKGYSVTIATYFDEEDFYKVPESIQRIRICEGKANWRRVIGLMLMCFLYKGNRIISFSQRTSCFVLLPMLFRPKVRVIASERNIAIGKPTFYDNLLAKVLYRRANYIVPNSYTQRNILLEKKSSWGDKVVTITNYTDIYQYHNTPLPKNEIVKVGIFGRYHEQKNYERFALAVSLVKKQSSVKFSVDWYGDTNYKEGYHYNKFLSLIKEYDLEEIVHLHHSIKNVSEAIQSFEVMCLPSIYEGFSNSLSEYICCGRPILASNVSDNSLMVEDGKNGFLFNPKDENDICKAFLKYFSLNYDEKSKMAHKSREIAEKLFNPDIFVGKYISLLENK